MIAAVDERAPYPTHDFDPRGAGEALLIEQLAQATRELRMREAEGRRTEEVDAISRSLRRTLQAIANHGNILEYGGAEFLLKCTVSGELELWRGGKRLGMKCGSLRAMFDKAGVHVEPGQLILVDNSLARRAAEESLVALTLEELRIREEKKALLLALGNCPNSEDSEGRGRPHRGRFPVF